MSVIAVAADCVIACAAVNICIAAVAYDRIIAFAAHQRRTAPISVRIDNNIVAVAAVDRGISLIGFNRIVVVGATDDRVDHNTYGSFIDVEDHVRAVFDSDRISAPASRNLDDEIVAARVCSRDRSVRDLQLIIDVEIDNNIVAVAAREQERRVIAIAAERIVALASANIRVPVVIANRIVACAAVNRNIGIIIFDSVVACTAVD